MNDAFIRICRGLRAAVREGTPRRTIVKRNTLKVGDRVTWNSEAGRVSGRIITVRTRDVNYKGYTHHARKDEPPHEIQSDTTDHIAMHKGSALKRHLTSDKSTSR